ncbi:MAG: hypothetical protein A2Z45_07245 [Chloroflexi bacterium RBG_19FT_COMBO_55_16]|nr:MAG: hypothetical protein A2Z45_07245 [Chloroflexi bacterium RBG_19FT_COMBO_55_16]
MKPILIVFSLLIILFVIGWLGLRVKPKPFPLATLPQAEIKTVPLPQGLPAPVERFYRTVYGDQIPVIETVVITGHGRIRPFGVWLPARFVFVHKAGKDYRHYIEATFFGLPFLKVNEGILDGKSFFESPMGNYHDDPNTNQGANLALWAEAGWFPALWVTDPRVRWQAVDAHTAILFIPFEGGEDSFVVRFDPETGLVDMLESMRYRDPGQGKSKILWITRNEPGVFIPGTKISAVGSATWLDQGKPWAFFSVEEMAYNLDVSAYIRARGK